VADWGFLTNHARVLLYIARDPGARLRDIAAGVGITERRAHGIITDLAEAGYVITQKDGRRNRYQIQTDLSVPEPGTREPAVGEVVALFAARRQTGTEPSKLNISRNLLLVFWDRRSVVRRHRGPAVTDGPAARSQ
jgi:hypothetical protein